MRLLAEAGAVRSLCCQPESGVTQIRSCTQRPEAACSLHVVEVREET